MPTSVSSELLRSLPSNELCFLILFRRPIVHRQGFGTMDALTPLPTGLPACRWLYRFGLHRFASILGLGPALTRSGHPVRHAGTSGHRHERGLLGSPLASSEPRNPA